MKFTDNWKNLRAEMDQELQHILKDEVQKYLDNEEQRIYNKDGAANK